MPQVCWQAAAGGRYWMDVALGNYDTRVMIDLGLIDPLRLVGLEVDPVLYHRIKQAGQFSRFNRRFRRDASGRLSWTESGLTAAQVICPTARQRVGPAVRVYVSCSAPGVPNRVGIVFFHRLSRCRVLWELDQQMWCIEYP